MAIWPKGFFLFMTMILFLSHVYSFNNNGGITLDLIHRDSFDSSENTNNNNNRIASLRSAFRRSFARKRALSTLASRSSLPLSSSSSSSDSDFNSTLISNGGEYLMKVKIGTPPVEIIAIADTGSDLTWTQCAPCEDCFNQSKPLFDTNQTSSYRQVSCTADLCNSDIGGACEGKSSMCAYSVMYGDLSYSGGDLATETFTFDSDSSSSAQSLTIPKVVFGCGQDDGGDFGGTASGIVGLGGGNVSIIRQLDSYINGRFSYCLTPFDSTASSKISFGSNAVVSGPDVVSTPLLDGEYDTFYYVTLEGITVGDEKFVSSFEHGGKNGVGADGDQGNMIIDSGTTLTFIPQNVYELVESAVANATTGTRVEDPEGLFDLCYDVSSGFGNVPKIVVHFTGADVALPAEGIFVELEDAGTTCFTLVGSDDGFNIFGNLQQMNYHIGFDVKKKTVSFSPTDDCSKDQ